MTRAEPFSQNADAVWVPFPGGELEGRRPKALCPQCRMRLKAGVAESTQRPLCFQCYRAGLAREQAMARAAQLDTGSAARFHDLLPLEPVNKPRLDRLRMERAAARARARISAAAACVDRRRHAQIAARHALQQIGGGLHSRDPREREAFAAARAAELQLPESWLPFVVAQ